MSDDTAGPATAPAEGATVPAEGAASVVEGRDGDGPVLYSERLLPPWWMWLVVLALTATFGAAYGGPYGAPAGWVVFTVATAVAVAVLIVTAPVVRVDDAVFRAGRARLPRRYVGTAVALDADAARSARTVDADARAFLLLRTWASGRAVRVDVTDPQDPHPYWLVTARHPERVVAALAESGGAPRSGDASGDAPAR